MIEEIRIAPSLVLEMLYLERLASRTDAQERLLRYHSTAIEAIERGRFLSRIHLSDSFV
jgi:hypothetical protein